MSLQIYGAGGVGRETATCARLNGTSVTAFVDDTVMGPVMGIEVITPDRVVAGAPIVIAVADPVTRARLVATLAAIGANWASVIDPNTTWLESCTIGAGVVILPKVHVSVSAVIADHVQLHYGVTVGHDSTIGESSTVLPGAHVAGAVTVGPRALIGSGAVVLQGRRIGADAVIGAGAVVTRDVAAGETVVGVPARLHSR